MFGFGYPYGLLTKALDAKIVTRERTNPFSRHWMPPESSRYWHDPTDSAQCARLQASQRKRARRADNAEHYAIRSFVFNNAHKNSPCAPSLDPTYVAK